MFFRLNFFSNASMVDRRTGSAPERALFRLERSRPLGPAPRGCPVLRDVYWIKGVAWGGVSGSARGGPWAARSGGSRIAVMPAAWAAAFTPGRNQPIVATATASESLKMLAVASALRV